MKTCEISSCNNTIELRYNDNGNCVNARQRYCDEHTTSPNGPNIKRWMMYKVIKQRCKANGREFVMTWDGFITAWPEDNKCPVFGFELQHGDDGEYGRNNSPSVDRIDSSRGYSDDNIQIISKLANTMKQNATEEQLLMFAEWITKNSSSLTRKATVSAAYGDPMAINSTSIFNLHPSYNQVVHYG